MTDIDFLSFTEKNFHLSREDFVTKAKLYSNNSGPFLDYALDYYYDLRKDCVMPSADSNVENVRKQLLDRSNVGLEKYGTTTERDDIDLAGWLQHLQEELMDAAVYVERIKQELKERPELDHWSRNMFP